MSQFGGKNAKKSSSDSKRHFTVVMGGKEHGLYVSSTPSSAARKAVTKLCTANKSKKVEFSIREITQGSKKKTYGPYKGYIEKLKEPIELKGRVIRYKPVAKLSGKSGAKKGGMRGGMREYSRSKVKGPAYYNVFSENGKMYSPNYYIDIRCNNLGEGNKNASAYAKEAKEILENDEDIKVLIDDIEIDNNFLRIHLTNAGQRIPEMVKEKAERIVGCQTMIIKNTIKNKKFIPPSRNISLKWSEVP